MPRPYPREFRDDVVRVARNREDGVTHRIFIELDRETTEVVKPYRDLIEPKKIAAPRIMGILAMRPEPSSANPLVAGSSPARPTKCLYYSG